jgi:hypothetical protein
VAHRCTDWEILALLLIPLGYKFAHFRSTHFYFYRCSSFSSPVFAFGSPFALSTSSVRSLGLLFNLEDGGSMFPQNVTEFVSGYTASYPIRQSVSWMFTVCYMHSALLLSIIFHTPLGFVWICFWCNSRCGQG